MKYVWFILLLTCCTIGQTTLSDEEIKGIYKNIKLLQVENDSLKQINNINNVLITKYEVQAKTDSLLLVKKNEYIELLNNKTTLLEEKVKVVKPKWYDNKYLWYGYGIFSIVVPVWITSQIPGI
jgi:hypothetical protein|tara:strand:+ start:245 stop:616 length:372 start_codon:yes stop_codon:yes gene_type:complete